MEKLVSLCHVLVTFPSHLKKLRSTLRFWLENLNCGLFFQYFDFTTFSIFWFHDFFQYFNFTNFFFQIHFGNEVSRIQANVCQFFFHRRSENPFGRVYRSTGNSGEILVHRFGRPWRHYRRFGCFVRKVQLDTSKYFIFYENFSM